MQISKITKDKKILFFIVTFIFCCIFLFWKCQYGFGKKDEALYLTTTYRLYQGDSLFFDEQHISQLYSYILYPIMFLYMKIFKNVDGILLNFRYIYVIFQIIVSYIIYVKIKKHSELASYFCSIIFLLYAPYNLMALSYNTICYSSLVLSLLFLLDGKNIELFFSGILFSFAVLCNPYLSFVYIAWILYCAYIKISKKDDNLMITSKMKYFTIGVILEASLFIVFCLSRASLISIISSIKDIVIDPEYPSVPIYMSIINFIKKLLFFTDDISYICIYSGFIILIFAYYKVNKKNSKEIFFLIGLTLTSIAIIRVVGYDRLVNYIIFPINIFGLYCYILYWKKDKKFLIYSYLPSLFYIFCNFISSDMGMESISSSSIVCLIMSIYIIIDSSLSIFKESNYLYIKKSIIIFLTFFVMLLGFERLIWVFSKQSIKINNTYIDNGPYSGIKSTSYQYEEYEHDTEIINYINNNFDIDNAIFLTVDNWIYLIGDEYKNTGPSTWKTGFTFYIDDLNEYYSNSQRKKPDLIYVSEEFKEAVNELDIINLYTKVTLNDKESIYIKND